MVRPGSGRFGVGFWVGFRVGLRARDFPTDITSAECDSALIVLNTSKTSSSPLPSSFATGLTSSRDSSSIMAKKLVSDNSDDEDVEYKGHFCSECSIPPPGGVRGWVRGYGGVGLWEAGPGCACCEDYD